MNMALMILVMAVVAKLEGPLKWQMLLMTAGVCLGCELWSFLWKDLKDVRLARVALTIVAVLALAGAALVFFAAGDDSTQGCSEGNSAERCT